ncbi:unnamed protein product [Urochloa decumbens]|uniref:Uncharacterized protein n=1 Tax=Urochloa decumbens TaxID=240449 RepID=A0ABC8VXM2_9POAL
MEGGGGSAGGGGGVLLGAVAQEPRELQREEKGAGAAAAAERKGGGMKFRVSARAPHGVGAILLIGGAAVVGAAVLAWRSRSRRGKKGGEQQRESRQPAKGAVLGGGVVEDGKVQGVALVPKLDQSNEKFIAGNTEIGSGRVDGKATEESHQIHGDKEIVADQLDSKPEDKIDDNSVRNPVDMDDTDKEHVEEVDQNSSKNHVETTTHDICQDNEHVEKADHVGIIDQNSSKNPVETLNQEVITVCLVPRNLEVVEEDSSKNNIEKEIAQKDNKDVKVSDQSKLSISGPGIIFSKNNDENDGIQEAESMENTPTAQLMMQQDQLLDDMVTDAVTETDEVKQGEGTIRDESELEQDEKKALAGLIELVSSPAASSLVKPVEKKGPELPGLNETGMKIEQDHANGELREHGLINKGGGVQGGAIAIMDRRSPALAILALIFAMTIGITIIVRLYAPTRATKLQMDL